MKSMTKEEKNTMGKHILLLGIGQTGCDVSEAFLHRMNNEDVKVHAFAIDTDVRTFANIVDSQKVPVVNNESLLATVERLGVERVREFFPCEWLSDGTDFARGLSMNTGANLWRMKAYLSFIAFLEDTEAAEPFHTALREIIVDMAEGDELELYTAASLVGGTGSALFLPLTLYVKKFLAEAGAQVSLSVAMLLTPDVYREQLTAEQRVKASANAYAAQSELNAVNSVLLSTDGGERPKIDFKLGGENLECGVLFDSERKTKQTPPFDKVVLLSRTPGVNTVGAHVGIVADILVSMATSGVTISGTDENKNENNMAIYEGISLTRVRYSPDSISEYIAAKQTEKIIGGEFAAVHKAVKAAARGKTSDARALAFRGEVDETEQYCNAFVTYARNVMEDYGGEEALIARTDGSLCESEAGLDEWREDYERAAEKDYINFLRFAEERLQCDAARRITDYIKSETETDDPSNINNRKKKGEKPRSKRQERDELIKNAARAERDLEELYESICETLTDGISAFRESLLENESSEGGFSFISSVMMREGVTPHPSLSLLRLCMLYLHLKRHISGKPEISPEEFISLGEFPEALLITDSEGGVSRYSSVGSKRFVALVKKNPREVQTACGEGRDEEIENRAVLEVGYRGLFTKKKYLLNESKPLFSYSTDAQLKRIICDDTELFVSDLKKTYERTILLAEHVLCERALEILGRIIDRYRELGDSAVALRDDLISEARLASVYASTDNGVVINVATSKEEKEGVLLEYLTTYTPELVRHDDTEIAKQFIKTVITDSDTYRVNEIADFVNKSYKNRFVNSEFYKENIDKNVICALLDSMKGRFAPPSISYERVFGERFSPIRVMRADFESSDIELIRSTRAIFSSGVWNYVADNPDIFDGKEPKEFFEARLYDAGEYRGAAICSDYVDDREILIRREISGIPAYLIEEYNENSSDPSAKRAYDSAKAAARAHGTAMWNPDVIYKRGSSRPLPLISPTAEREYELSSARALLYALLSGGIYVSALEDKGDVYYTYSDGASEPILLRGEPIGVKDVKSLAEWAYSNPEWARENSSRYEAMFHGRQALHGGISAYKRHAAALLRSASTAALAEAFSTLIIKMYSAKALDYCGYAFSVASAVYDTVKKQSIADAPVAEEGEALVYNAFCDAFMQRLIKDAKGERARNIVEWLNSRGLFLRLVPPMDFQSYEL